MPTGAYAEVGITLKDRCKDLVALLLTELFEFGGQGVVVQSKDGNGVEGGIPGSVNGHGGHGDARRHLHYGEEGVQPVESFGFNRDADITKGQSYTVVCGGMRATTTVRTR